MDEFVKDPTLQAAIRMDQKPRAYKKRKDAQYWPLHMEHNGRKIIRFEAENLYSKFGVSRYWDEQGGKLSNYTIRFPENSNPIVKQFNKDMTTSIVAAVMRSPKETQQQIFGKQVTLEKATDAVLPLGHTAKKEEVAETHGAFMQVTIYNQQQLYLVLPNGRVPLNPSPINKLCNIEATGSARGFEGYYSVHFSIMSLHIGGTKQMPVFNVRLSLDSLLCEPIFRVKRPVFKNREVEQMPAGGDAEDVDQKKRPRPESLQEPDGFDSAFDGGDVMDSPETRISKRPRLHAPSEEALDEPK